MIRAVLSRLIHARASLSRGAIHVAIACAAVLLFHVVSVTSGRLDQNRGFGWDGETYARMVSGSLDQGSPNTQTRPLIVLVTRIPYALGVDLYDSFRLLNYVYAFVLYLLASLLLARGGVNWRARIVVVANLALCIATSKMFAFYPVLIDLGALALTTLAFYLAATDRHRLAGIASVLAAASREFGVATAVYGMHRALRQRRGWGSVAGYLPGLVTAVGIRVYIAVSRGPGQGPLSIADAVDNLAFWTSPGFAVVFVYFAVLVLGGLSALLIVRLRWSAARLREEPELISFLVIVVGAAMAGSADVWRYLVFVAPVLIVLIGKYLAECDADLARRSLIAMTVVTVITQRPVELMDRARYFLDWFPLYYALGILPSVEALVPVWTARVASLALLMFAMYYAVTPLRSSPPHRRKTVRSLAVAGALIVAACWPVRHELRASEHVAIEAAGRVRVNWEIENRRLLRGELPLWNPTQFAGQSHLSNPQTLSLYPPHVILRLVPIALFFPLSLALHAMFAGWGGYLVARQLGVPIVASAGAGVAAMLAGVFAPVLNPFSAEPQHLAWIPLALAFAMRSTARAGSVPHPALIAIIATGLLSGSVRGALYVVGIVAGWYALAWTLRGVSTRDGVLLRQFGIAMAVSAGLAAVVLIPSAELHALSSRIGGLTYDVPSDESWHSKGTKSLAPDPAVIAAVEPLRGHRTLLTCQDRVDESQLSMLGIPVVGGYGGVLLGDYAWFSALAARTYPERNKLRTYAGLDGAGRSPSRPDLVRFFGAEYLLACIPPTESGWKHVGEVAGAGLYINQKPLGRAVWTCAPEPISRAELEHTLERLRYDDLLTLKRESPLINVRWSPHVTDEERARAEQALHLSPDRFLGDRTWRYELMDASPANAEAIVRHPLAEDTAGLDRANFQLEDRRPSFEGEEKTEWLLGATTCTDTRPAVVLERDRPDGHVVAQVEAPRDGIVLFSEAFNPQRSAWVDGRRVQPLKVNLAFTGVLVRVGSHRVELRYRRGSLMLGFGLTAMTFVAWVVMERRHRRTGRGLT